NAENDMDADKELAKKLPYREMSKNGWVPETRDTTEKVIYLRKYFEVVNLEIIKNMQLSKIACRRLAETEKSNLALLAWAQKAKLEARTIETSLIDLKTLKNSLLEIRSMTTMNPSEFCPKLIELLSNCGIALVFLPHIGGSFLHGATFYDGNKIVVGLTVRGKDADKFWFSLFHELGHILLGHINQPNGTTEEDEDAADSFAREILIPTEEFKAFTAQNDFSKEAICAFAQEKHILCGIVVGRLQKEGFINYNRFNDLKTKYILSA
ncbi:ImmA/IrrE family metallo-endopeptidase, partial [Sharpea azabuensis]